MSRHSLCVLGVVFCVLIPLSPGQGPEGSCVGAPATSTTVGAGCGNPPPALLASPPVLGGAVFSQVMSAFPMSFTFVYMSVGSFSPIAVPGSPGCFIFIDLGTPSNVILVSEGLTDSSGTFTILAPVPPDPSLIGLKITVQAEVWTGTGPVFGDHLTNGVLLSLGC